MVELVEALATTPKAGFAIAALIVLLIYAALSVTHNLFFHRLASFPGPRLAAATYYWRTYFEVFEGNFTERLFRLHAQYGPSIPLFLDITCSEVVFNVLGDVVRISPNEVYDPFQSSASPFV